MKPNTISLNIIADESRFMTSHIDATPGILERLFDEYRRQGTSVSCFAFGEECRTVFVDLPINEFSTTIVEPKANPAFKPDNQSSLLESACRVIDEIGERLAALSEEDRPEKVVVAIITAGQDSVSDFAYTKDVLREKIRHQSDVYSWQFVFPLVDFSHFHPTVVRIREPIKKTTFQFAADLTISKGQTPESVFATAIDYAYEWISLKLGASTPPRERFDENFEFDQFILPTLKIANIPEEGHWCARMVHADEAFFGRPAIAGLTWTSDIALHRENGAVHFAMRIFVTSAHDTEGVLAIRPRLVSDLGRNIGFTEGLPLVFEQWNTVQTDEDIERLFDSVHAPLRQMPIVLIATDDDELVASRLFRRQARQSIRYFAYVATLPESLRDRWTQKIGDSLSLPFGGARIYYPFFETETDAEVGHPCYGPEEINSWDWDYQYGKSGFSVFLKETLANHSAEKPIDWGSCLFYPRANARLMELRRQQWANLPDKEYVRLLEEESTAHARLKKEFEEKEREIKELERERFELRQQLEYRYRSQSEEIEEPVSTTKISLYAHDQLKKINGKQRERLDGMLDSASDESWRRSHSHRFIKTDLYVFKDGKTNPAWIAGFPKDGCFHVTHVFSMHHDEYERILNDCKRRDVEGWEFVPHIG